MIKKTYRRDVSQMGKITKKLKADDIGDMGIGAMIVFIAMVLVAGIAASVLIQTANRLEIQAMQTGQQTIGEVSTGIGVTTITGARTLLTNTNLNLMTIAVQPRSGSYSIDLGQTYIELSDSSIKVVMKYDNGSFVDTPDIDGSIYGVTFPADAQSFGVVVLQDADSSLSADHPVLNSGDQVALTVNLDQVFPAGPGIAPRIHVWGTIQSEQGAPGVFAFVTPSSYAADLVFTLY
jgi:flagellin FlaB